MAALTGKAGRVKYTSANYSTAAGEAFTSLSATTDRTEFRITDGDKRHWTQTKPPLVFVNSTAHTDFAYNPVQGKITFGTALTTAESALVTGTVYWHSAAYLPWTRSWSADVDVAMHDVTCFSTSATDVKWRTFIAGLSGASIELGRVLAPTTATSVWFDRLIVNQDCIVELNHVVAGTTYTLEAYGRVDGDGFDADIDALVSESVSIQVDGPLYYATTE